mgnify:CR=1 FL=1
MHSKNCTQIMRFLHSVWFLNGVSGDKSAFVPIAIRIQTAQLRLYVLKLLYLYKLVVKR